jgi:hypothetical protein
MTTVIVLIIAISWLVLLATVWLLCAAASRADMRRSSAYPWPHAEPPRGDQRDSAELTRELDDVLRAGAGGAPSFRRR